MRPDSPVASPPETDVPNATDKMSVVPVGLAVITSCLSSGMLAKFMTKASGRDSAGVASFNVNASFANNEMTVDDNGRAVYKLELENSSKLAASYSVTLNFGEGSDGIKVTIGEITAAVKDGSAVFENVGTIGPEADGPIELTVQIDAGSIESDAETEIAFTADVTFTQID